MSYRAIVDLTLGIDSFRNVGMFQQGVYFLTYKVYYEREHKKIYANPYANIPFIYSASNDKKGFRNVEPSEILLNEPVFKTRAFCIRYKHEEIPMNEVCQFRSEIDTDKQGDFLHTEFYVETKLHFLRFKFDNGWTLKFVQKLLQNDQDKIKWVSSQKFKLNGCLRGMTEYLPTTFKGVYFSVSHGIMHSALIDFKWRDQLLINIDNDIDENGILVESSRELNLREQEDFLWKYSYTPPSLKEFFLGKEKDFYQVKYNQATLENIFDCFISPLILNWENLKRSYETIQYEEHESIFEYKKSISKGDIKDPDLEFWGIKLWKRYSEEETKDISQDKENQPIEREQADWNYDSDEEGDLDVGEEESVIQKVYAACFEKPKEFYLNYTDLKETFIQRVYIKNASGCVKNIEAEINTLAGQIIQWNFDLLMLIGTAPEEIREYFRNKHCTRIKERVEDSVFRSYIKAKDFVISGEDDSRELYKIMAEKRRSNVYEELLDDLPVEDMTNLTHDTSPVMIEEVYTREDESSSQVSRGTFKHAKDFKEGLHLFVLVHGFQATHIDMQEIKNHIAMVVPNSVFMCSCSNEGKKTNGSIEEMGQALADEIFDFFEDEDDVGDQVTKISFIGHSMGGIIIRCALPLLSRFRKMMHGYCSLSSPHLGYASCKSKLVKLGLWAMQAFNKPESIKQLSMGDAKDIKDTFMYKISSFVGMKWFKHIMLFSSVQDGYVTFDSARIQIFKNTSLYDPQNQGNDYIEMATNILDAWKKSTVTRVDVNFCINEKSIDHYIGRKAHILFLSNTGFLTMFTNRFKESFFDS